VQRAIDDRRGQAHPGTRQPLQRWLQLVCLGLSLVAASVAFAVEGPKRIVVLDFDGAGSTAVRGYVVNALGDHEELDIVPMREVENAASRLGVSFDTPEDYVRVAEDLELSAFIGGSLGRAGKNFRAKIWVRNGATGEVVHEEPWSRKNRAQLKTIEANFWEVMGPHIMASSAPTRVDASAEPAPPPPMMTEESLDTESPKAVEEPPSDPSKHPALIASIGPRLLSRTLQFDDDPLGNLRSYETKAAFEVAIAAQWYPGAHSRSDWLANIGLDVDADYAIGLKSKERGKSLATTAYELGGGLIVRIPLDMFEPRIRLGYVRHVFDVDTASTVFLPSMTYSSARLGLGTALKIVDALSLDVGLAYLFVLDAGDLTSKSYFPKADVRGYEAGAGAVVQIAGPLAVRGAVDWRRYAFDLKPDASKIQPGGQKLADRATDDYLRFTISLVFSLGQNGQ